MTSLTYGEIYDRASCLIHGVAKPMPENAWYPERAETASGRAKILCDNHHPDAHEWIVKLEDSRDPHLVCSPEQALYVLSTLNGYQLKDEYDQLKNIAKLDVYQGILQTEEFAKIQEKARHSFHLYFENSLKWFLDNAPDHFVVMWARLMIAILRIEVDLNLVPSWKRFNDNYQHVAVGLI